MPIFTTVETTLATTTAGWAVTLLVASLAAAIAASVSTTTGCRAVTLLMTCLTTAMASSVVAISVGVSSSITIIGSGSAPAVIARVTPTVITISSSAGGVISDGGEIITKAISVTNFSLLFGLSFTMLL
ncbi:hypothetical protein GQ44DRAFT_702377 [Phaeosphaeriaceae sp. PMI808]|nr:hypothetical protein GQ44DRAFT_702377 [Phaeosphaeriaceae sp. PMI808]